MQIIVPPEHQSKTPGQLRTLATALAEKIGPRAQQQLLDAAAEIEGGEEAFATVVREISILRGKLATTERNLRAAVELLPRSRHLK